VKVAAPGKLMLTGSYAVLEGAPAIVCAVNRLAVAGGESRSSPSPEVVAAMAAMEEATAPGVDVSELFSGSHSGGHKLGLGSSAAAVVAALGYVAAMRGQDLDDLHVRRGIFERAHAAHARVQSGGSGVDVAASTYGGVLRYQRGAEPLPGPLPGPVRASIVPVVLPPGLHLDVYFCGQSVRTSEMRKRVDAFGLRDPATYAARMGDLSAASVAAASAIDRRHGREFVEAACSTERGLTALGRDADVPIVPPFVRPIIEMAEAEDGAFLPSGAGGGDVFVRLGLEPPSSRFATEARAAGLERLELRIDTVGVRVVGKVGESSS
jgi:phosphomevalonate kinase